MILAAASWPFISDQYKCMLTCKNTFLIPLNFRGKDFPGVGSDFADTYVETKLAHVNGGRSETVQHAPMGNEDPHGGEWEL
jgi:hypothetical protein